MIGALKKELKAEDNWLLKNEKLMKESFSSLDTIDVS